MQGKGLPLVFRAWSPAMPWTGRVGHRRAEADKPALEPDILLVPLLAFDRQGWRLGYGGGFYDRTLAGAARAQGRGGRRSSATTSRRSTRCRISTMTSGSTGC